MKYFFKVLFFGILFCIYYVTSFDRVSFGDCMAYVNMVEQGELLPNASSADHFLYTNSMIIFKTITGLDSIVAIRLFDSLSAIIALFFVFKIIEALFNSSRYSFLGTVIFAFSFSFWRMASTIEVCTFNTIFLGAFLYYVICFFKTKDIKFLSLASLILGISFWIHVQNIMIIPSLFFLYFYTWKNLNLKTMPAVILFLGSSLALFIPSIILKENLTHVYGSSNAILIQGTFTKSIAQYLKDIVIACGYLIYNFWYFIIPAIYSIWSRFKKPSYLNIFLAIAFIIPFAFGTFYNVSDNYVYFLGPYQIFLLYIIDGIILLSKKRKAFYQFSWILALTIPLMYIVSYQILIQLKSVKKFDAEKSYKGGLSYYTYPWMINNKGILEITIDNKPTSEPIPWMLKSAKDYINIRKDKETLEKLRKK